MSEQPQHLEQSNSAGAEHSSKDLPNVFDRNSSLFSSHESDSRLARGLDTKDTQVKNPERGLIYSDISFSGDASFHYDANQRMDGLSRFNRTSVAGGVETNSLFQDRPDGLLTERSLHTLDVKEREQSFDPSKRSDGKKHSQEIKTADGSVDLSFNQYDTTRSENGLLHETVSRENGTIKTTKSFENHPQDLQLETSEQTITGTKTVQNFADGRKNDSFTLPNGTMVENKAYDKNGRLVVPERPKGPHELSSAHEDHQDNYLDQFKTLLDQANFTLAPLQKGWGPYQGLQVAVKERGLDFSNLQIRDEAIRIKNREFSESNRTSFKVGEQLAFYSPKEINQSVEQERARYLATIT